MRYKKSVFRSLAMVTQLGLCVLTPIFLFTFAGYQMDSRFGTKLLIPLLILGVLGGGRGAYLMAQRTMEAEIAEDKRTELEQKKQRSTSEQVVSCPKRPSRVNNAMTEQKNASKGDKNE